MMGHIVERPFYHHRSAFNLANNVGPHANGRLGLKWSLLCFIRNVDLDSPAASEIRQPQHSVIPSFEKPLTALNLSFIFIFEEACRNVISNFFLHQCNAWCLLGLLGFQH
jgi:hypothetical protein